MVNNLLIIKAKRLTIWHLAKFNMFFYLLKSVCEYANEKKCKQWLPPIQQNKTLVQTNRQKLVFSLA